MNIFGTGVDIVETSRIATSIESFGDKFLHRIFCENEISYCRKMSNPLPHFAARFAAKEAVSKAFGTGIGADVNWLDVEVKRKASGEPFITLHGAAQEFSNRMKIVETHLSLSHTDNYAVAQALLLCD